MIQPPTHIDLPTATDSLTNKPSSQKASLYHTCRAVLNGLTAVPGFDYYLMMEPTPMNTSTSPTTPSTEQQLLLSPTTTMMLGDPAATPITSTSTTMTSNSSNNSKNDPLSKLWFICRQGASLCLLFNTLKPESPIQLLNNEQQQMKPKACVYHFIIACRDQLGLDQEGLFTVSDLFQDDTNGFVKVVNTVKKILELLENNGIISIKKHHRCHSSTSNPKDTRSKVVIELLETERKYVQDLESLQYYMREAQAQKVLPPDTLHQLFGNLNALVDFQRRFLIHAEDNADRPPQEQRFGSLFVQLEDAFSVYEPFCANFQTAQALVVQETAKLQKLADIMSPSYELPSMLIKPVQRVCKYPLLLQELVKTTPEDWTYYGEMKSGLEAIQRVTSKVNETKRRQENMVYVEDLLRRILDQSWKGAIPSYGCLLLHERFVLYRNDVDYSVLMYLFEKSLFICTDEKDTHASSNNKKSNGISSVTKKKKSSSNKDSHHSNNSGLNVKGRIFISQLVQVTDVSQTGLWSLRIYWSERDPKPYSIQSFNLKSFILKCRNGEQLRQWEAALSKLIQNEKRLSRESRTAAEALVWKHQQPSTASLLSTTTDGSATLVPSIAPASTVTTNSLQQKQQQQQYYSSHHQTTMPDSFSESCVKYRDDDDDEEEEDEYDELMNSSDEEDSGFYGRLRSHSQNNTQQQQHLSHPHHHAHNKSQSSVSLPSSYAHSSVSSNSSITRNNQHHPSMPGMTLPPLPRDAPPVDTTISGYDAASSPPLSYPSSPLTNSYPSSPSASTRASTSSSGSSSMWQQQQQRRHGDNNLLPNGTILNEGTGSPATSVHGGDDYTFSSTTTTDSNNRELQNNNNASMTTRMRSQSSPNIHQHQTPLFEDAKDVPLPINSRTLYNYHQHQQRKRLSTGYQYEEPTCPLPPPPPLPIQQQQQTNQLLGANVKVKLNYLDGIYVIIVPLDITYTELLDRIDRKIRVYFLDMDTTLVGLKYQDEDGDLITMNSTEDVQMGFESRGASNTVNFFVVTTKVPMPHMATTITCSSSSTTTTNTTLINGCTR
ncbi:hypothetical protein BDA99DRAFT_602523 [Phascolomyces articulosus]|uniref:Uncharacterized protein n=1 Tax=Phascolomyces articulosus TaxID=60185 RepID=A0AAD5PGU7_9FUNG|nr:hypothetical protein BDA99DRAFT_602523 [Phascolomyces articulosus]